MSLGAIILPQKCNKEAASLRPPSSPSSLLLNTYNSPDMGSQHSPPITLCFLNIGVECWLSHFTHANTEALGGLVTCQESQSPESWHLLLQRLWLKTLSGNSGWPLTVVTTTFFWGYGKTPCPHHPTFSCSVSCSPKVSLPAHAQQRPGWVRVKLHPTHLSASLWSGLRPMTFIECPLGTRHDIRPWQFNFMANHYYRHNTFYCTLYFLNCLLTLHRHFIF